MAMTTSTDKFNQDPYLSPDQQDLLLAALTSNNPSRNNLNSSFPRTVQNSQSKSLSSTSPQQGQRSSIGSMKFNQLYESPQQQAPGSDFDVDLDNSPFIDYELDLDADGNFDYDIDGQMIGNLPRAPSTEDGETETHEKRKSMDDHSEEDGGGKRREGEDKTAKKPGRKPLTSEPTSVSSKIPIQMKSELVLIVP
jgi:AP-1-like transcription factor